MRNEELDERLDRIESKLNLVLWWIDYEAQLGGYAVEQDLEDARRTMLDERGGDCV